MPLIFILCQIFIIVRLYSQHRPWPIHKNLTPCTVLLDIKYCFVFYLEIYINVTKIKFSHWQTVFSQMRSHQQQAGCSRKGTSRSSSGRTSIRGSSTLSVCSWRWPSVPLSTQRHSSALGCRCKGVDPSTVAHLMPFVRSCVPRACRVCTVALWSTPSHWSQARHTSPPTS